MNRYIITRESIKGQEFLVSALYDERGRMLEVIPERAASDSILGNIYIGRVENIVKNLNAAFVRISPEQSCYLSMEDCKNPIFTKKQSVKKKIAAGDELLVQVCREALKTKEPAVTANLNFTGKYAVLTTGNRKFSVSTKLPKDIRSYYKELLAQKYVEGSIGRAGYGIIIRTNAKEVSEEQVLEEIKELECRLLRLTETAAYKTCCQCVYREASGYLKHLCDLRQGELAEIVTDDRDIFKEVCSVYQIPEEALITGGSVQVPVNEVVTESGIHIRHYTDLMLSLSSLYSVKPKLEEALKQRVWLKSGAYLVIEHTEALTVVDVNTGKNIAKRDVQENFLKVNLEAAAEIAHQLRLRNISGMILIDFMNLTDPDAEAELLRFFRQELKKDPVPARLIDMTKLGLVEVTRKKVKKSLLEQIG